MKTVRLQLPATSANLGPGFDTLALALNLFLDIEAQPAAQFSIQCSGRNHDVCGDLRKHLLIETYRSVLGGERRPVVPLALRMKNGIPLGMGLGSSAAVRLAGVALAAHFGGLRWDSGTIVEVAARLEGHPDNVAACWYGGLTVAGGSIAGGAGAGDSRTRLSCVSLTPPTDWRAIIVLPENPVATEESRSVLPERYSRADTVKNLQNVALLTAAFALGRSDLLPLATEDTLHQPYRMKLCPLLPALLPLAGTRGILSVTLSGAGPSVLVLWTGNEDSERIGDLLREHAAPLGAVELIQAHLLGGGATFAAED